MENEGINASCSLEDIANLYPKLYSQKRLDDWKSLFDERASVVRIERGKPISCFNILDAMPEQYEYANENVLFSEEWGQVEIRRFENIAVINAAYCLTADREIRKGTDVLTLVRQGDGWRIINLVYEQTQFIPR